VTERLVYPGSASTERRRKIVEGGMYLVLPDGRMLTGRAYRPKGLVYMTSMPVPFDVTMDAGGIDRGFAGDALAVGFTGELYVIRASQRPYYEEVADIEYVGG
jgi:hypothetical protein